MNDWIPHTANSMPVAPTARVDYVLDGDEKVRTDLAGHLAWGIEAGEPGRLCAYRVLDDLLPANTSKPANPKDAVAINKLPMHLVSPIVKAYQAISHFLGNVKYGAWNYRVAGVRLSVYKSALERHVDAWWEGEENDPTDGTPHLANALACLNILIEAKYTPSSLDDRPPRRAAELAAVRQEFEALMPKIRERYAHMNPHHCTELTDPAASACADRIGETK